ncbi:hypothetical protein C8R46DRAFT_1195302 [Mycena filopes]|nr:hypothetical protein C8R46DRAFT_1195302 [Mycena filopes]
MPSVVRLSSAAWLFGPRYTQALIASISSFLVSFYHTAVGLIPSVARARQIKTLLDTLEDPTSLLPALHFSQFPAVHFNYAALPFISSPPRSPTPPTPSASLIICACVAAVLFMSATFWIPIIIPASIPMLPLAKPTASIELAASPAEELPAPPLKPATPLAENLPAEPVEETAEPALLPAVVIEAPATPPLQRIRAKSADGAADQRTSPLRDRGLPQVRSRPRVASPTEPRRRPSKINFLGRSDNLHAEIYENLLARENRSLASSTGLTYGSAR